MKTYLDCLPCFIRQALDMSKLITDDEAKHIEILRKTMKMTSEIDMLQTPPQMAQKVSALVREITGVEDPYYDVKKKYNDFAIGYLSILEKDCMQSHDPITTAIKLSMAGNVIDFGVNAEISREKVIEDIHKCLAIDLHKKTLAQFHEDVKNAKSILYLGDNCGEIVFDKLFIEQLPLEKVTFAVRGKPVINDVTIVDAKQVGLDKIVKVIDNGHDAPGTVLEDCSKSFRKVFDSADVIISKGQGNYETLSECPKNIYFSLKIKCPVIARHIKKPVGEFVFLNNNIQ